MTSECGWQTTKQTLPNISQSRDNQTMKFGQLIEYNKQNIFLHTQAENEEGRLIPDLFLFFEIYEVKVSDLQPSFIVFW